jgi:hypothetical protein
MSDNLLCRQGDVKVTLKTSITKFCEGGYTKVGDLMKIIEEEFSKIPLFEPIASAPTLKGLKEKIDSK